MSEDTDRIVIIRYNDNIGILFVEFLYWSGGVSLFFELHCSFSHHSVSVKRDDGLF